MNSVVIVESPAKAKTINKYLGPGYEVLASYGHVRDLPAKDGSVDPNADFHMLWEVDGKAAQRLNEIARAVKGADRLILATDPDREGEAISWHVLEVLRAKKALKDQPVERVVFNAITKQAILDAMKKPREIDAGLVDAYLARRALDYLVGFNLSPVLWRKLPGARSAGRVQSVALRLVCDREAEIERFVPREYWSLVATLATPKNETFEARISAADGKKIGRLDVPDETTALALKAAIEASDLKVANVEAKPGRRNPPPPFTTSTLQQEASRKLGLAPNRTMQIAQRLYEGIDIGGETVGLITYMRTDGVDMDPGAVSAVRSLIGSDYGARYLPGSPRKYTVKAKNAQEAHEAVRPTDPRRTPREMARRLDDDQARLYELIWKRTVASQMESAEVERTTVDISATGSGRPIELRATGTVVTFDGFLALYQEGRDDEEDEEAKRLPAMAANDPLRRVGPVAAAQHHTEPPPRYTEAALVKRMEELGIGRPSTYAATLAVLRDREYVKLDKKRLVPDDKGRLVTAFLESFFDRYVEYDFTAALEEKLDKVSNNELDWKEVLRDFWRDFIGAVDSTKELRFAQVIDALNEILGPYIFPPKADGSDPRACPTCGTGQLSLKLGKFGSFVGCSNYPECRYTRPLGADSGGEDGQAAGPDGVKLLGQDPKTGLDVTLRAGRFGPYVQLGEPVEKEKPKRASLPKGWSAAELDLEAALRLLSLPRLVGLHPESGLPIEANIGRYGPYVSHDGSYANLDSVEEVFEVGLNRAVAVIAEKKEKRGAGRGGAAAGRALGDHPDGGAVTVHAGRYGPYVKHGKVNATLPKGVDADALTLDEAIKLVDAKAAAGGAKKPARKAATKSASKAAADKPAAKKATAAKKPAAKKPAAKTTKKAAE
ncbi:DNA topoisomerase 1 [Methylopila jiangsuensis]|uniref:DNA topoisomerase 1 n=1 Tax=Methylopila jiangsuensis TaxID=586230 RepID=A0A9W6N319_9HYPH|nr:type I DNA topoisomerase [Methylopila jiangsuensis]MDR6286033.1 DNA topoisomerase-1 [Methylopila jiangsuensis]GLK75791.1 DNA topoisomerase 1 [Methylopila jiangsuensis]